MKKLIIAIVVLMVVGIGVYYFVFNNQDNTPVDTSQTDTSPAQTSTETNIPKTQEAPSIIVDIEKFSFSPETITIKTGTKVTWVNNDSAPHAITSDSGGLLNSKTLSKGQSFSFTFTDPDSLKYHCNIHPTMKGNIIVKSW